MKCAACGRVRLQAHFNRVLFACHPYPATHMAVRPCNISELPLLTLRFFRALFLWPGPSPRAAADVGRVMLPQPGGAGLQSPARNIARLAALADSAKVLPNLTCLCQLKCLWN